MEFVKDEMNFIHHHTMMSVYHVWEAGALGRFLLNSDEKRPLSSDERKFRMYIFGFFGVCFAYGLRDKLPALPKRNKMIEEPQIVYVEAPPSSGTMD